MKRLWSLMIVCAIALAACGGGDSDSSDNQAASTEDSSTENQTANTPVPTAQLSDTFSIETPEGWQGPSWTLEPLVNANTGELFAFASFAGKPIYVQGMALSCRPCIATQETLRDEVVAELGTDDFVFISLSMNIREAPQGLADYADENNFPWLFTVVDDQLNLALRRQFGAAGTNFSASPRFIISPNGEVSDLALGALEPQVIIDSMRAAAEAGGTEAEATEDADAEMTEEAAEEMPEATAEATEEA